MEVFAQLTQKIADKIISIRNNGVNAKPENARLEIASSMGLNLNLAMYIQLLD